MPRDANGNMTLPAGNPVVDNTKITTDWANPTVADLAAEVEDSLSRSGKGGMLVPFYNADGSQAAPGISFTNQTGTGFFRSVLGIGASVVGTLVALWDAALTTFKTAVRIEGDLTVTGTLTAANIAGGTPVVSGTTGAWSTVSGSLVVVPALTTTITTTGRPVLLSIQPQTPASIGALSMSAAGGGYLVAKRNGSTIFWMQIASTGVSEAYPSIQMVDAAPAGVNVYTIEVSCPIGGTMSITQMCLFSLEL